MVDLKTFGSRYPMDTDDEDQMVTVNDGDVGLVLDGKTLPRFLQKMLAPYVRILTPSGIGYISPEYLVKIG